MKAPLAAESDHGDTDVVVGSEGTSVRCDGQRCTRRCGAHQHRVLQELATCDHGRDILFGSQLLGIEERIQALEGDLKGKMANAREEIQKESKALESRFQEKTDSLKGELDSEKWKPTDSLS